MSRAWTGYDTFKLLGTIVLLILLLLCLGRQGALGTAFNSPSLSSPALGTSLPARLDFSGKGHANGALRLFLGGKELSAQPLKIGADGNWSLPGVDISKLGLTPGSYDLELRGVDPNHPDQLLGSNTLAFRVSSATNTGGLSISQPADGAQLEAGGFTLKGRGNPGDDLEVFEDGISLGRVTVASDGSWSLKVPSPAAGSHTYEAKGTAGSASTKVAVAAATGSPTSCTKTFSLSLSDGQTVNKPFRFGGEGSGKGYTVTIKRGSRVVGIKVIPLDATCGWSYTSNPGSGPITYEVREAGAVSSRKALAVLNLKVQ